MDEREVGAQRRFHQIFSAVDLDLLLAFLDDGADSGRREYATESAAAGADAFDQRALRNQIDRHLARDHLLLRLWIETDVACDGASHQTRIDKFADSAAGEGRVVGDDGEIAFSLPDQFIEQTFRGANPHEPANHQGRAVWN